MSRSFFTPRLSPTPTKFLSVAECTSLLEQAEALATGGGVTGLSIESTWTGYTRWARNRIMTAGDARRKDLSLSRDIRGAASEVSIDMLDSASLAGAVRRAERLLIEGREAQETDLYDAYQEPYLHPHIFFDTTYDLEASPRAAVMQRVVQPAVQQGMVSAGYLEVSAHGRAVLDSRGTALYYPYTLAQYSVTVRDPKGVGSGWAGVDWNDWTRIDTTQLSDIALDKCLRSRNPVAIEPGRYTTILEPQAVCDLFCLVFNPDCMDRNANESFPTWPFHGSAPMTTKIGTQVFDTRLTVTTDPMDPDLGFPPFSRYGEVFHPTTWIENGILQNLAYERSYGVQTLGLNTGLPTNGAYRMSGGTTTVDEMIATTKRGVLVTRFSNIEVVDKTSLLFSGYTRDGLWLVENGKISKPIKNFRFTESPMFVFNSIEQLGVPQRVFHPTAPVIVPPVKVRDFSFTALADAV